MFIPNPGSGFFSTRNPGSRGKKHKKHRIPDPDPQQKTLFLRTGIAILSVLWLLILIDKAE
jgi:hypothetical protein